tara:strand:- start:5 stop:268 length:264 start_codon:yes stop_codon:yes gene_type:complete
MKTKSNLEASAPGRLPGRFSTITNPLQQGGTMPSIEFISFDKDNNPNKKVYEGKQINELLINEKEIGQIITECMFGEGKVNINQEEK